MPRPPRPRPVTSDAASAAAPSLPPSPWARSWRRGQPTGDPGQRLHRWYCELCRTYEVVQWPISPRALEAALRKHRLQDCDRYRSESGERDRDEERSDEE